MFTLIIYSNANLRSSNEFTIKAVQNLPAVLKGLSANAWLGDINNAGMEIVVIR
ncbi:MAG: hypothetical protein OSA51_07975 [Octadecabacter sp.]|nr:hypothetical protein [Octadecabacter sp.]